MEFVKLHELLPNSEIAFDVFSSIDNELYVALGNAGKAILVTSAVRGEGRSTIALIFAMNFMKSKNNKRVLFINADRGGSTADLEEVLGVTSDGTAIENAPPYSLSSTRIEGLDYARSFSLGADKVGLDQEAFENFTNGAKSSYDLIVVDAAPGTYGNDLISIAKIITNVILVIQHRGAKKEQIQTLVEALNRVGANILGTILNKRKFPLPAWLYGK
jgi:Mrp family chromosome partitioning ATPase